MVAEAQLAFINHRYREAEALCHQALMIDRRNAIAHEIMGDIYLKRGQQNAAATSYSYAIQFNPRNYSVQVKLERCSAAQRGSLFPMWGRRWRVPRPCLPGSASPTVRAARRT